MASSFLRSSRPPGSASSSGSTARRPGFRGSVATPRSAIISNGAAELEAHSKRQASLAATQRERHRRLHGPRPPYRPPAWRRAIRPHGRGTSTAGRVAPSRRERRQIARSHIHHAREILDATTLRWPVRHLVLGFPAPGRRLSSLRAPGARLARRQRLLRGDDRRRQRRRQGRRRGGRRGCGLLVREPVVGEARHHQGRDGA